MWDEEWAKCAEFAVQAHFGKIEHFYKGLDWHLGLPNPDVMRAMQDEHTKRQDSEVCTQEHKLSLLSCTGVAITVVASVTMFALAPDVMHERWHTRTWQVEFITHNYGSTSTCPAQEWEFVLEPIQGKAYPGKVKM